MVTGEKLPAMDHDSYYVRCYYREIYIIFCYYFKIINDSYILHVVQQALESKINREFRFGGIIHFEIGRMLMRLILEHY